MSTALDPARRAELEDERRFLLASLADLEREHEAGDLDEHDYRTLKDGYTARAAAVLREIDGERRPALSSSAPRGRLRRAAGVVLVALLAVGLGLVVARMAGQRLPGQTVSGGIAQGTNDRLAQARSLLATDPRQAIELYTAVLKVDPDNVEARTYSGWLLALQAAQLGRTELVRETEPLLDQAIRLDPNRPDAHCFKAVVRYRFLDDAATARQELERCQELDPPAEAAAAIAGLAAELDAATSGAPTTTSVTTTTAG